MVNRKRGYHHGDLRTALLDEAAVMIVGDGVEALTMRELGRRLGVSRAAPYRHFLDKEALLVAVAAQGFERLRSELDRATAGGRTGSLERFHRLGDAYVRFALENPAHYRLMYGAEALERQRYPELEAAAMALFEQMSGIIHDYQRTGVLKGGDVTMFVYVAWSAMHGLASLLLEGHIRAARDIDALVRFATRSVLDGIRRRT